MTLQVYFNHDGGIDDLVSLFLLLQMDNVELTGISIIDADCYIDPATSASQKIIKRFGNGKQISIAQSTSRGKNPFPREWRMHAFYVDALPILNELDEDFSPISSKPAHLHLIDAVQNNPNKTVLLFTGPLTDLARALDKAPEIENKIEKLIWMGGTYLEKGNVEEPIHDGTAEWNSYWDPFAVARVFKSNIKIDMVALESTNKVPFSLDIRGKWAKNRSLIGLDFMGQCYAMCQPFIYIEVNSTYYLWDVLTTTLINNPSFVKQKTKNSIVHTTGQSQGKIEEHKDGRPITIIYDVDKKEFFDTITDLAKKV